MGYSQGFKPVHLQSLTGNVHNWRNSMDLNFTPSCVTGTIKVKGLSRGFALEEREGSLEKLVYIM